MIADPRGAVHSTGAPGLLLIALINAINVVISFLVRDVDNSLGAYDAAGFRRSLPLLRRHWLSRDLLRRHPDLERRQDWARVLSPACCSMRPAAPCSMKPPAPRSGHRGVLCGVLMRRPTALVSVAHRPTLRRIPGQVLELDGSGARHPR